MAGFRTSLVPRISSCCMAVQYLAMASRSWSQTVLKYTAKYEHNYIPDQSV